MGNRLKKLDACWEYSVTLVEEHGRVLNTNIGQGHIMTLTYADGHKLIIDELCSEVSVSLNIRKSAENSYYIDIDSDNDTTTAFFKVTKDGEGTTLFTVNEDGSISFSNGLSVSATGDVSLGFGDLVSEQNPDGADAIRIKGTDCIDVVIGGMTGLFAVWNVADNTPVFYVNERGDISVTGSVDMNSHKINELTDPVLDQDAATKKYVDDADAALDHGALGGLADDDHTQYTKHVLATAASDFLVASGAGVFVKKTLAEAKAILLPSYDTGFIGRSDFTNVRMGSAIVDYDNLSGTFTVGEVITEATSGNTGIVTADTGSVLTLKDVTGTGVFIDGRELTGSDSGATADVNVSTKNTDESVAHNLDAPLSDLLVKVLISTDGTDANSFEIMTGVSDINSPGFSSGLTIYQGDNNNITVQTGVHGIVYLDGSGGTQVLDTEDWFYKIKVYKLT